MKNGGAVPEIVNEVVPTWKGVVIVILAAVDVVPSYEGCSSLDTDWRSWNRGCSRYQVYDAPPAIARADTLIRRYLVVGVVILRDLGLNGLMKYDDVLHE